MTTATLKATNKTFAWQQALSELITSPAELLNLLELDIIHLPAAKRAARYFPLRVPRGFVERMQKSDLNDPLLKQVLPIGEEFESAPDFTTDPLQESKSNPIPGVLHKYQNRILITLSNACAINCRFCFRRHFPYAENNPGRRDFCAIVDYVQQHNQIEEVVLSGGDPLVNNDGVIELLINQLSHINHLKYLRIHSRLPIVLPERITPELIQILNQSKWPVIMITHCNHPNEINHDVKKAVEKMKKSGISVFNQAVLLRGVNDNEDVMKELSHKLFSAGITPYYVHTLDKVQGTAHFSVSMEKSKRLLGYLKANLPGYLVPKFVTEQPDAVSKTWL